MMIRIGPDICIAVGSRRKVSIRAPKDIKILRQHISSDLKGSVVYTNDETDQIKCPIVESRKG